MGAPAFMRGKERSSAPGNSLDSIMRFSAGNARVVLYISIVFAKSTSRVPTSVHSSNQCGLDRSGAD